MPQQVLLHPSHVGYVAVSEETVTFATAGTERRIFPVVDSVELAATQTEVEVARLSHRIHDPGVPVKGYRRATGSMRHYLQPATTYLASGATADADAAAPLRIPLRVVMGGESVAAGSTIPSGTYSTTSFDVASGHGARFPDGTLCLVDQADGGTEDLVPCRVRTQSTDTLTVWPALANAPNSGSLRIINSHSFYLSQTNTRSLSLSIAPSSGTAAQYRALGGTGSMEITFTRDALLEANFSLTFADHAGPAALSVPTTPASDPMASPMTTRGAKLYLQPLATTTRSCVLAESVTVRINTGMEHRETLTCGTEGMAGVMRSADVNNAGAEMEFVCDLDTDYDTATWTDRDEMSAMLFVTLDDSAGNRRAVVVDMGTCIVVGKPAVARGANNLMKMTVVLRAKRDTSCTDTTDLATSPVRLALI